jgi:hypothetical protein
MTKTAATRTVSPATKKFILEQIAESGKISFRANGQIDFFREEPLLIGRGAGGPVCTILPLAMFFVDLAA